MVNFSLVSGWFPPTLIGVAVGLSVLSVGWRHGWLRQLLIGVPLGIALGVGFLYGVKSVHPVPAGTPDSMLIWIVVAVMMIPVAVVGWPSAHWTRKVASLLAVPLLFATALNVANETFQYYPTVLRLFGREANHFLDNAQLNAMRAQARKTGKLPPHGATISVFIPPTVSHFSAQDAYVWLPPAWFLPSEPRLPVVELLAGVPGDPSDWTRAGFADSTALAFAQAHDGRAPILVMPDQNGTIVPRTYTSGDTECANSKQFGNAETYLVTDVPAFMRKEFNAKGGADSFAVAGLAAGGTCAVTLALRNPAVFSTFASYSGYASPTYHNLGRQQTIDQLYGGSVADYQAHDPAYLLAKNRYAGLSGWFETGLQDSGPLADAHLLVPLARRAGIDTCALLPNGAHDFDFWGNAFRDSLPWLSWKLGVTPEPASLAATCSA